MERVEAGGAGESYTDFGVAVIGSELDGADLDTVGGGECRPC